MFSFTLVVKILQGDDMMDPAEWRWLLTGPTSTEVTKPQPTAEWMTTSVWLAFLNLARLPALEGIDDCISSNMDLWFQVFDATEPQEIELLDRVLSSLPPRKGENIGKEVHKSVAGPGGIMSDKWVELTRFQKLLIIRSIRPDKLFPAIMDYISVVQDKKYIMPPAFEIEGPLKDSAPDMPLIFVLSTGADPMQDLRALAEKMRMKDKMTSISLGQGQGPKAEKFIREGLDKGNWVCLQNCHLATSWMGMLEYLVEKIDPNVVNKDFRLWLTSMPSKNIPVSVLQIGVKMTLEPPKGMKNNLFGSYSRLSDNDWKDNSKPEVCKRLVFATCLFHAVVQERRKFGPLGFCIRYELTDGDRDVNLMQTKVLVDQYDETPLKVLQVLFTDVNYGGRVTDDRDRRLMSALVLNFINKESCEAGYKYSPSGVFRNLDEGATYKQYMEYISELPATAAPEIFGMHDNADITCNLQAQEQICETILSLQTGSAGTAGKSQDDVIDEACADIMEKVVQAQDMEPVYDKYPVTYNESYNTVLHQELIRYNKLLNTLHGNLKNIRKAIKGLVVMSEVLEKASNSIFNNQVPAIWEKNGYPSLKPLSAWVVDLAKRMDFVLNWVEKGIPPAFWISGFFFPQGFVTGTLQNFARKYRYPISVVSFDFIVIDDKAGEDFEARPEMGCYIYGLFLEAARWDYEKHILTESKPKQLYTTMPPIWLKTVKDRVNPADGFYMCPCYKILTRAGLLSTTGHSTNFIQYMEVPSDQKQEHWINRSVALFTMLKD